MDVFFWHRRSPCCYACSSRLRWVKGRSRPKAFAEPALLNESIVSFKSAYSMVYRLENVYILTPIRSCQFSQGDIYRPQGMWSQRWGLNGPDRDSQGFHGVNPTSVTYARPGGILFEISSFENSHDLLCYMNDTTSSVSLHESLKRLSNRVKCKKRYPYPSLLPS